MSCSAYASCKALSIVDQPIQWTWLYVLLAKLGTVTNYMGTCIAPPRLERLEPPMIFAVSLFERQLQRCPSDRSWGSSLPFMVDKINPSSGRFQSERGGSGRGTSYVHPKPCKLHVSNLDPYHSTACVDQRTKEAHRYYYRSTGVRVSISHSSWNPCSICTDTMVGGNLNSGSDVPPFLSTKRTSCRLLVPEMQSKGVTCSFVSIKDRMILPSPCRPVEKRLILHVSHTCLHNDLRRYQET